MPSTPRPKRTPQPGTQLPSGNKLEDLFKQFAGMPPPPGPEDKYSPEQIIEMLKQGKLREVWEGRYGPVGRKELDLEELERSKVQSFPKMNPFGSGGASFPGEPIPEYRKELLRMFPTPTPTPTIQHQDPPYWYLPIQLRELLAQVLPDKYWGLAAVPYHPIRAGGQK